MGRFLSALEITPVARREYEYISPLIYIDNKGRRWEAEKGRRTDLGSTWGIPIISELFDGLFPAACGIHDLGYDGKDPNGDDITRLEVDDIFHEATKDETRWMLEHGLEPTGEPWEAETMYLGVQMGGASAFRGEHDGYITDEAKAAQDAMFGDGKEII